jgi:cytochrome c biogenesis protein CcmG, thiol:disulfide interchange protein DsbE
MSGMPRTLALTLSLLVAIVAAGAVSQALEPAASPRATSGKPLSLDEAIKELELIRPPRPKFADDFTIPTASGKPFKLSAQRGRPVFINFWATWCPPCLEEMPALERLWRAQKDGGFVMLAVTVDSNPKLATPFVERHGLTFTVGFDPKMELANTYGVRALPSSFVIDRDGRLAAVAVGPRVWDNTAAHALIERLAR